MSFGLPRSPLLLPTAFAGGGALALLIGASESEPSESAVVSLSFLSITFGLWLFWTHGGARITGAGVWGLSSAAFVGGGGLYGLSTDPDWQHTGLLPALWIAFFGQVLIYALFWTRTEKTTPRRWTIDPDVCRWGTKVGAITVVGSTLLALHSGASADIGTGPELVFSAGAFAGVVLLAASLLLGGGGRGFWRSALVGLSFAVYALYLFSGFGRLNLVALALCIAMLACGRYSGRAVKGVIILAAVPTLLFLGMIRSSDPSAGLISAFGPLGLFGRLLILHQDGQLPWAWGSTFWASAVALFPRTLWAGKPVGFGVVLAAIVHPQTIGTGNSDAALSQGEWLYNFGLPGLVLMIPVIGWLVRRLDYWLGVVNTRPILTRRRLLWLVAMTILATGLANLAWVGTFTYVIRTGAALVTVGFLSVLDILRPLGPAPPGPARPRPSTLRMIVSQKQQTDAGAEG